jgi:hypothetical protein
MPGKNGQALSNVWKFWEKGPEKVIVEKGVRKRGQNAFIIITKLFTIKYVS